MDDGTDLADELTRILGPDYRPPSYSPGLKEAVQRRLESIDIEDACDDDRAYFKRNRRRNHRVRYAYPSEVKQFQVMKAADGELLPDGKPLLIAVKQIEPGRRIRLPFINVLDGQPSKADLRRLNERKAAAIYESLVD